MNVNLMNFSLISIKGCLTISNEEIEKHLELGRLMLSRGQYSDALSHYHMAVGMCYVLRQMNNDMIIDLLN